MMNRWPKGPSDATASGTAAYLNPTIAIKIEQGAAVNGKAVSKDECRSWDAGAAGELEDGYEGCEKFHIRRRCL